MLSVVMLPDLIAPEVEAAGMPELEVIMWEAEPDMWEEAEDMWLVEAAAADSLLIMDELAMEEAMEETTEEAEEELPDDAPPTEPPIATVLSAPVTSASAAVF
jgi:hypothetical protein